jgi:PAS domain S-box-containing protein
VCITDAVLFKIITQQLIIAIAIIGIIMICQVLITGFMVKKQLFSPLEWLKKMVAMDFVSTKFPSDEHVKVKEFVAFENVLREMGEKIYLDAINKRKSEIALIESEKKYRDIFENSTEGIFQTNSNGHFISCNPAMARMLGYDTTNDVIDKIQNVTTDVYVHPEDRERFKSMLLNYGTVNDLEIEIRRKNGEHAWGTLSARLIVTGDGDITYEGTYRDITERKHAQEQAKIQQQQLIQADKMASLGLLVSGIGHEINNPTNFITLNAPLLKKVWENVAPVLDSHVKVQGDFQISGMSYSTLAPNVPSLIDGILNGAKRIQRIVSDLKEYARPDSNKPTQIVDVNSAVKSAISLMDHKLHKCSDHVNIEIDPRPLTILGNLQRIEQVVINLLHNACDAIKEKQKSITITTGIEEDAYVFIKIADQGEGIKEENIIKLTDPFFTTKRDHGGTGLGLSVSAGIIKEHCGLLKFDSVYGSGTTVTIHLPYVNSKT